jgi:hypothetical protein
MSYDEALHAVVLAAIHYCVQDMREQRELRQALDIVIREQDRRDIEQTDRDARLVRSWLATDDGRRQ